VRTYGSIYIPKHRSVAGVDMTHLLKAWHRYQTMAQRTQMAKSFNRMKTGLYTQDDYVFWGWGEASDRALRERTPGPSPVEGT
jgi:hypothetical protein